MTTYRDLETLLGAYFHQDWDLEGNDWIEVVDAFARAESLEAVAAAERELRHLLRSEASSQKLQETVASLGCAYTPPASETIESWLYQLAERLSAMLSMRK